VNTAPEVTSTSITTGKGRPSTPTRRPAPTPRS
jgi:hypothetical protein